MKQLRQRVVNAKNDLYVGFFAIGLPCIAVLLAMVFDWMGADFTVRAALSILFVISYLMLTWIGACIALASLGLRGFWMLLCWPAWVGLLYSSRGLAGWVDASIHGGRPHELEESATIFCLMIGTVGPIVGGFGLACHLIYRLATADKAS